MPYRDCRASQALLQAVNTRWPNRDKASDGWIGDAAHASRSSDHNPWIVVNGWGVVRARDIDKDGIDAAWLAEELRKMGAARDPRLIGGGYVIFNRRITKPDFSGWQVYNGSNPHTSHIHVSFSRNEAGFDSTSPWANILVARPHPPVTKPVPAWPPLPRGHYFGHYNGPVASHGGWSYVKHRRWTSENDWVKAIQNRLNQKGYNAGTPDGVFGNATVAAVRRFQLREMPGTQFFGQVWADDWRKLFS